MTKTRVAASMVGVLLVAVSLACLRRTPPAMTFATPTATTAEQRDIPVRGDPPPVRRITVQRTRVIHVPPARPAAPVAASAPPQPRAKPTPPPPPPPDPAREAPCQALGDADTHTIAHIPVGKEELLLLLSRPETPWPDSVAGLAGPLVLAASTAEREPADAEGWTWTRVAADDPLFVKPSDVRKWWRESDVAWRGEGAGKTVLWLPVRARAGWEAREPRAMLLWKNLLADPRWRRKAEDRGAR
ncbi:MAG: hypothetical protein HYU66_21840 [Armatimonadetes bacterium]|nr:hypothetical protein [Armatimonadota bacterium]